MLIRRLFCALLVLSMLLCLFPASAGAVAVGNPFGEDLTGLYEMKYGHSLDRLIAGMTTDDISSYPFYGDPQVKRVGILMKYDKAPGGVLCSVLVLLNTKDEASLDAFIAKYAGDEKVVYIEKDGFGYIPETRYAVSVALKVTDEDGGLLPDADYSPAFFGGGYVRAVYTVPFGETAQSAEGFAGLRENSPYYEAALGGAPERAVLELTGGDASSAAAFALELIGFENSAIFTEEQKEAFRQRLADVSVVAYDGLSGPEPLRTLTEDRIFKVWASGDADPTELVGGCDGYPVAEYGAYTIWYLRPEKRDRESLYAVGAALDASGDVICYLCYDGVTMSGVSEQDALARYYVQNSVLLPGDADGDGDVSVADARAALRHAVGLEELPYAGFTAADTDGSGSVSVDDARTLLRAAIGLIKTEELRFFVRKDSPLLLGPLESYHDGGYVWNVSVAEGDESGPDISEKYAELCPPIPGSGPCTVYEATFRAPGDYTLHIDCRRPWDDGENVSVAEYDVNITVL